MQAAADQADAEWGRDFTNPIGTHYRRLIEFGIEPQYAIQLAGALQSHLMKIAEYKLVQNVEAKQKAEAQETLEDNNLKLVRMMLSSQPDVEPHDKS